MSQSGLKERIAALEQEVAALKAVVGNGSPKPDWRSTIGMFTGDEVMKEVFAEALKIREADRQRARRKYAKSRRATK